jgi:hypothetical protein
MWRIVPRHDEKVIYYVCLIMLQLLEGWVKEREDPALVGSFAFLNLNLAPQQEEQHSKVNSKVQFWGVEGAHGWAHVSKWHKIILPCRIWCFHL